MDIKPLKIALFGGTGETGVVLIQQALTFGHEIVVYARNPAKITFAHPNLRVVKGDLQESDKIADTIQSCDAVISLLGPTKGSTSDTLIAGMNNIVSAMQQHKKTRLIATLTPTFKDERDTFQLGFNLGALLVKTFIKDTNKTIQGMGKTITSSPLDWTLVRLPMLSNNAPKKPLHAGYVGDGQLNLFSLSRSSLANFLIDQIQEKNWIRKAPAISN